MPDQEAAIEITEAVLRPLVGRAAVIRLRPYHAILRKQHWFVSGLVRSDDGDVAGGVATVELDKVTGRIYNVTIQK